MSTSALAGAAAAVTPSRRPRRPGVVLVPVLWGALGIVILVVAWIVAAALVDNRAILPGPELVLQDIQRSFFGDPGLRSRGVKDPSYLSNMAWTVGSAVAGWAIGSSLGIVVGLLSARRQWARNVTEPILFVFGAVPVLVVAPFFLVWFGSGIASKLVLVSFYCFVVVGVIAQSAALVVSPVVEEYAAALGLSRRARFRSVVLPSTVPAIISGLRLSLATGLGLQAAAELLGSEYGIGRLIVIRASTGNVAAVLGLALLLGLVAVILDQIMKLVLRSVVRWQ